jgi:hypothetical protein
MYNNLILNIKVQLFFHQSIKSFILFTQYTNNKSHVQVFVQFIMQQTGHLVNFYYFTRKTLTNVDITRKI